MARNHRDSHWRCKASGCETIIPETLDVCAKHWHAVPKHIRDRITEQGKGCEDRHDEPVFMAFLHDALAVLAHGEGRKHAGEYHERAAKMHRTALVQRRRQ